MSGHDSAIPEPGEVIAGRYEVMSVLGRGGGGVVYRATQLGVGRDVALKILPAESQLQPAAVRRFEREARLVSRLSHPNTVTLYEFNRTPNSILYIVMEFVDGVPLKHVLRAEGAVPPERAVPILRQILKSLAEAHSHGIVHRDLKPANIMLCNLHGEKDFVKVLDFGVATVLDAESTKFDEEDVTITADVVGTPKYMAPEQFRSDTLTPASDLYAWACIAYEMLSGFSPFEGETLHVTIAKHLFQAPPELPDHLDVYPTLTSIIAKLLQKDPTLRYQSSEEVLTALERWDEGIPLQRPSGMTPSYATTHANAYIDDQTRLDVTPEPGFDEGSSADFPIIGNDDSARMRPNQVPPFTNTPSFPIYSQSEGQKDPSDTDPNMLVMPDPSQVLPRHAMGGRPGGAGDARKYLLIGLMGAALVLALVAVILVAKSGSNGTAKEDRIAEHDEPEVETDPDTEGQVVGAEGISFNDLDQTNLLHFLTSQGLVGSVTSTAEGAQRKGVPKKAAADPKVTNTDKSDTGNRTTKKYVTFSFDYQPKTATVKVKGGKKRKCGNGNCTIKAEDGAQVSIEVSAEGRAPQTKRVKASSSTSIKSVRLFRRSN